MADVDPGARHEFAKHEPIDTSRNRRGLEALLFEQADRCRILRDFQDSIVDQLIGMRRAMEKLKKDGDYPSDDLIALGDIVDTTIASAHRLADDIAPHVLLRIGLEASLRELLKKYACDNDFTFIITCDPEAGLIDETARLTMFQVLKRVLRGIVVTCRADLLRIDIRVGKGSIAIIIEDDGRGFDLAAMISGGQCDERSFLWEATETVRLLGGSAWAEESRGISTTRIALPLHTGFKLL